MYFWRTKQQQEVDFVEEIDGQITGFEFKWKASSKAYIPKTFKDAYQSNEKIIDRSNFRDFVIIK